MAGTVERTLALKLIGDVSGLRKDLKPVGRQFGQLTKSTLAWGKALSGAVVIGGIERVVGGLGDAFKGFKSGQRVAAQLRKTWRNLGMEGRAYGRTLDAITQSTLRLGTSDDEAVAAFTRSIQRTGDYQRSLRELTIAQDLVANGSAPNLDAAMKIIQQAAKGSARVVDRFGLDAETAGGRVRELGRQVRGAAREKAKLDPFGVLFNRIAEDAETIVGSFASGDFSGFVKGIQGLGTTIDEALFGRWSKKRGRKVGGLVKQFGNWGSELAQGIQEEFGKVDWGKTLSDTMNSALGAVADGAKNGTLANIAILGGALAGAIFAVDLFTTAASVMFKAPRWALGAGAKAAGAVVGLAFRTAMFAADRFLRAAGVVFEAGKWAVGTVAGKAARAAGAMLGVAFRVGMFVASKFTDAASTMFGRITTLPTGLVRNLRSFGLLLGGKLGLGILAGVAASFTAIAIRNIIAEKLDAALGTTLFSEAAKQSMSPLDIFTRNLQDLLGFHQGTAGAPRGWAMVGERGPELVKFRGSEKVMDNRSSMRAMGGTSVSITVNVPPTADRAAIGKTVMDAIDAALARGHRFRSPRLTATGPA